MTPERASAFDAHYERVLETYRAIGCPDDFIRRQAIGRDDGRALAAAVEAQAPSRIVEVGTFVGVSTMLLAASAPAARVWTIDPDPQLAESWASARNTGRFEGASARTVQAIGREAAERLGIADRIEFVRGGFASAESYLSAEGVGDASTVVGPALLEKIGAVDLFFIDGLHYEAATHADIRLAAQHLSASGLIVLHDTVGMWGTNVRGAVRRFLFEHPAWEFVHPPLRTLYRSIGLLRPRDPRPAAAAPIDRGATKGADDARSWLAGAEISSRVAAEVMLAPAPRRIGVLGEAHASIHRLLERTGRTVVERASRATAPAERYDLVLADSALEQDDDAPASLAAWCARHAQALLLSISPPGEAGAAPPKSWSRATWVDAMRRHGFEPDDAVARGTDPWLYQHGPVADAAPVSLRDLSLIRFRRDMDRTAAERAAQDRIEDLLALVVQLNVICREHRATETNLRAQIADREAQLEQQTKYRNEAETKLARWRTFMSDGSLRASFVRGIYQLVLGPPPEV